MAGYKYAFSLAKEEVRNASAPGTVVLISHDLEPTRSGGREEVQDHIRLEPQPSIDPADPLNWPLWRKHAILACICLWAWNGNFQSAGLASALPTMIMAFPPVPKTFPQLTHLLSVNLLFIGASNLWWVPLANTFGRRPVVLLGALMLTVFSIWAAVADSYNSLLAARCFMGIAAGSSETISPDIVGEVFFVHQRGRAMAVYTVFLALGPLAAGTMGSYVAAYHGWRWINWINAIFAGAAFVSCLFFQPETLFDRAKAMRATVDGESLDEKEQAAAVEDIRSRQPFRPYTFGRSLRIGVYRGYLTRKLLAPFLTLRFPGVWMVTLQYAGLVAGIVTISIVGAQLLSEPPYLWGQNAGLINIGAIIGALLGALYTFLVADRVLTRQAKQADQGFGEPEARLMTQFPGLLMATFGLWIFGIVAAHPAAGRWVGLQFGYGMLSFGLMQVPSVGFNYIIEAYNAVSGDCFVMVIVVRSSVSFAWTFFVGNWIDADGPLEPFGIFGMLMGIFTLLTIPMYIWGKRTRIATAKWLPKESDH